MWPIEFADLVNAEAPIARGGRPKEKAYEKVQPFTLGQWKGLQRDSPGCPTCFSGRGAELSSREQESEERDVKRKTLTSCS